MSSGMKSWVGLVGASLLLISCDKKSEIQVYRVVKAPLEEPTPNAGQSMPTNMSSPGMQMVPEPMVSGAATTTTVPPNWEPQPLSQMRQASFLVKGDNGAAVDISLVSLGTSAANVLDNVNRWLGQLGQPSINDAKLAELAQHLSTSIGDVTVVDLPGLPKDADPAKDGRIIAAMAAAPNGTLFFKMRGNAELTEAQKPDFMKWVSAVCSEQRTPQQTEALSMPANEGSAPQIKWKTPNGWNQVPAPSMRYASFNATEPDGAKVDVSIVTFPGDGGSDAENVNRWRRQIGLEPVDEKGVAAAITPVNANGSEFAALDMTGGDSRVVAAWTRRNGRAWFFKMTGPAAAVEKEKSKFLDFLRSIDFQS
jgi:hypothetical protein